MDFTVPQYVLCERKRTNHERGANLTMISTPSKTDGQALNQSTSSRHTAISELTGIEVDTYSEEWRHECECRWLLDSLPSKQERREYLDKVEKRRGKPAADKMYADALAIHAVRKRHS